MKCDVTIGRLKKGEKTRIVAFGDSLTQGWMVRRGYVDFLHDMLTSHYRVGIDMINRGIPGNTSDDGLARIRRDVLDNEPHCVILQFGLNDAYMGSTPGRLKKNLSSMIERIGLDTGAEILLVTSCAINNEHENRMAEEFYRAITDLAGEKGLPLAEIHRYWLDKIKNGTSHSDLVQGDMVHPTVEGYRLMAEAIMEKFSS